MTWLSPDIEHRADSVMADAGRHDAPVLLILGGSRLRELAACRDVVNFSALRVVILSSGCLAHPDLSDAVDKAAGSSGCLETVVDRSALDTVTNFSSLGHILASAGVKSVIVATDAAHALRARVVGGIVLGRYNIRAFMHTVYVADEETFPESWWRVLRDAARAVAFRLTGFDGSSLAAYVHPRRAADVRAWQRDGGTQVDYSPWLAAALRLRLRALRASDAAAWARYVAAHATEVGGSTLYAMGSLRVDAHASLSCSELAACLEAEARGEGLPTGWVPSTVLVAEDVATGELVGHLGIRHRLNAFLEVRGNHIGYIVAPTQRGRGHATRMLALALPVARALTGQQELRVDCDEINGASRRVIEKNGGRLVKRGEAHDGTKAYTAVYYVLQAPAIREG